MIKLDNQYPVRMAGAGLQGQAEHGMAWLLRRDVFTNESKK